MFAAAVQIHPLFALGVLSLLLGRIYALSVPAPSQYVEGDGQTLLRSPHGDRKYENGEMPPVKNTVGWVDPRLNGGQFLDVRRSCLVCFSRWGAYELCSWSSQYTTNTLGEPLNIIISAESDPYILTESGMQTYVK